ncbi:MAG: superoxide dismutase, Cu, Zn [Cyanobacteriota bacterium]
MQSDRVRPALGLLAALALGAGVTGGARAADPLPSLQIPVYEVTAKGTGTRLGSLRFSQTNRGLVVQADVQGLLPGRNSMHIHQFRSCDPAVEKGQLVPGAAAGPHWDPTGVMGHGAHGHGHGGHGAHGSTAKGLPLGDLPDLIANADGVSTSVVAATRLRSLSQILGRSVIVHRGVDGPKFACGLLPR